MSHNGWSNYETWNAKLWLDNDEGSYHLYREMAQKCWTESEGDIDDAASRLSDRLETWCTENEPSLSGMYSDLLIASLQAIDWLEIADSILTDEDLEPFEDEEDEAVTTTGETDARK